MLENLFLTISVEKSYYSNLILYWLMKIPFFKQYTNYTSDPKNAKKNLNIYFLIFIIAAPFFLGFCLIYLTAHNIINNRSFIIEEIPYYFTGIFCGVTFFLSFLSNSIFKINTPKIYCFNFLKLNKNDSTKSYFIFYLIKKFVIYAFIMLSCMNNYFLPKLAILILPLFIVAMKIISTTIELYFYDSKKIILYNSGVFKISMLALAGLFGLLLPKLGYIITLKAILITSPIYLLLSYFGLKYILSYDYNNLYSEVLTNEYILYKLSKSASLITEEKSDDEKKETYNKYSNRTINIDKLNNSTLSIPKVEEKKNDKNNEIKNQNKSKNEIHKHNSKSISFKEPFKDITNLFFDRYSSIINKRIKTPCLIIVEFFILFTLLCMLKQFNYSNSIREFLLNGFTFIPFILFLANATKKITKLMFYNCDASLLTYKFYRNENTTFKIFLLRFKKCLLYNFIPTTILYLCWSILSLITQILDYKYYIIIALCMYCITTIITIFYLTYYYIAKPYDYSSKGQSILTWIITIALFFLTLGLIDYTIDLIIFLDVIILIIIWIIPINILLIKYISKFTFKSDVNN